MSGRARASISVRSARTSEAERTNERATKSTPSSRRELEIVEVLARDRRDRERDAREVDALVGGDEAGDDDGAPSATTFDRIHAELDVTVVDQHLVADAQDRAEDGGADRDVVVTRCVLAGDDHRRVPLEHDRRGEIRALYAFCRATDDLVDVGRASEEQMEAWRAKVRLTPEEQSDPILYVWALSRQAVPN